MVIAFKNLFQKFMWSLSWKFFQTLIPLLPLKMFAQLDVVLALEKVFQILMQFFMPWKMSDKYWCIYCLGKCFPFCGSRRAAHFRITLFIFYLFCSLNLFNTNYKVASKYKRFKGTFHRQMKYTHFSKVLKM